MIMRNLGVLFFFGVMPIFLHAEAALKIGYVDFNEAFQQEHEAQKYSAEIEVEEQKVLDDEQKARRTIEDKVAKFQASMAKLSEDARAKQDKALREEFGKLQEDFTKRRMELNQKRQHILAELEQKNRYILDVIAKEKGYHFMLTKAAMAQVSDGFKKTNDETSNMSTRYNKTYPVAPVAPDAKKPGDKTAPKATAPIGPPKAPMPKK